MTFWPQKLTRSSLPQNASTLKVWWNSVQSFSKHCVNKAKKCIFQHARPTVTFEPNTWCVRPCPRMHQCWKFGENAFGTNGQTHTQTRSLEQPENVMPPAAGGIKFAVSSIAFPVFISAGDVGDQGILWLVVRPTLCDAWGEWNGTGLLVGDN